MNNDIKEICEQHGFRDPLELLTGLTNGVDLRKVSQVYLWLKQFEEEAGEGALPDEYDWAELCSKIKGESRYAPVSISDSLAAQKALMEYMHAKKKAIDLNVNSTSNAVQPLKPSEVKRFKRKFDRLV